MRFWEPLVKLFRQAERHSELPAAAAGGQLGQSQAAATGKGQGSNWDTDSGRARGGGVSVQGGRGGAGRGALEVQQRQVQPQVVPAVGCRLGGSPQEVLHEKRYALYE